MRVSQVRRITLSINELTIQYTYKSECWSGIRLNSVISVSARLFKFSATLYMYQNAIESR